MKKIILSLSISILLQSTSSAFCGFYVAKTDKKLFNNTSEVILVRDGNKTTITMSNDFKGDVQDFAMVVPVPVVLEQNNIRIADQLIFDKLDAYSTPRLVEYFDENPCNNYIRRYKSKSLTKSVQMDMVANESMDEEKDYGVSIKASYTIGEYDILILDAKKSNGLKEWLLDNGYKIPKNAEDVLEPYIKSNMKFFVAKVNLQNHQQGQFQNLRPIQMSFESPKFMLPIRLGMANSNGLQDLIIYSFTKKGHTECTNYRNVKIPTNLDMPEIIQNNFAEFYADLFTKKWRQESKAVVLKEYAWDISGSNYMHCDPCVSEAPNGADLKEAGVWWINSNGQQMYGGASNYSEDVFITRMHVRYDRSHFAQDLNFQITPNQENFQGRYVIHHPVKEKMNCDGARAYKKMLNERNQTELRNLYSYAGWHIKNNKIEKFTSVSAAPIEIINTHQGLPTDGTAYLSIAVILGAIGLAYKLS
jgi:hypothetical protein